MEKESPDILKNRILSSLKASDGLTIREVAERLGIHHVTASKYLAVLDAEKRVLCKQIGMAKVFKAATFEKSLTEFEAMRKVS